MFPSRKSPRIDIVPLVDVLMVLIVFFLTTMQFQNLRALNLKLPKIDTAGSNLIENQIVVSIDQAGQNYLNGNAVEEEELSQVLEETSKLRLKPKVLIVADEETSLKYVTRIVDLCRFNGLEDFRLQSR